VAEPVDQRLDLLVPARIAEEGAGRKAAGGEQRPISRTAMRES
jgi:hypothetical protein